MCGFEAVERFPCFGSACAVHVSGGDAAAAAARARHVLERCHERFSRFLPESELSRLDRDPRGEVPVTPLMARLVAEAVDAAAATGGLVDPTLVDEIERAGYAEHREPAGTSAPKGDPVRAPARPHPDRRWAQFRVDRDAGIVRRPPGLRLDSGGMKGLFADVAAELLAGHGSYAVDCGGDLRVGGTEGVAHPVRVQSPFSDGIIVELPLASGGVATSGIGRRSWVRPDGRPAHHLLDPATGRPAFTGLVQVTALATTAARAEALAKAALLAGPDAVARWLPHGGLAVRDDGSIVELTPAFPTASVS
jgi:FAD:protein FMN transferase